MLPGSFNIWLVVTQKNPVYDFVKIFPYGYSKPHQSTFSGDINSLNVDNLKHL